jgi:hypothetical protein
LLVHRFKTFLVCAISALLASTSLLAQTSSAVPDQAAVPSQVIESIADQVLRLEKKPLAVRFSPSIRLKSFDLNLSALVAKRAGPDFKPGPPTNAACGMQRFQMKLVDSSGTLANEFAVLLDPQMPDAEPKPNYLIARTEVLHVDADGAPRSYHSEDPLGQQKCNLSPGPSGGFVSDRACAMDTFGDAEIHVFNNDKELKNELMRQAWTKLWPAIRNGSAKPIPSSQIPDRLKRYYGFFDHSSNLSAFFKNDIIVASKKGLPCFRLPTSNFPGYFVSATALSHRTAVPGTDVKDADKVAPDGCTPQSWIDAATVPYFVLPGSPFGPIGLGGIAVIYAVVGGEERVVYAVIGDSGPTESFGEASAALLQLLRNKKFDKIENNTALNSLEPHGDITATILLLGDTQTSIGPQYTQQAIEDAGKRELAKWNGTDPDIVRRLRACSLQAPPNKKN